MSATQATAVVEMKGLAAPRLKGPGTKSLWFSSRMRMGMAYEIYSPMVLIETTACSREVQYTNQICNCWNIHSVHKAQRPTRGTLPAVKATVELSMGRPRMNAKMTIAHTELMGVPVSVLTELHSRCSGTPPSREKDQSILCACKAAQFLCNHSACGVAL